MARTERKGGRRRQVFVAFGVVAVALLGMQLVPQDHANPAVTRDAPWTTTSGERIARAACYDCHSNQTQWRWYSSIAPVSWWVGSHVNEGRDVLNFSEWDRPQRTDELGESVDEGMPPTSYQFMHAGSRLSVSERQELVRALEALPEPGR